MGFEDLSKIYELIEWPGNPYSREGRLRYEGLLGEAEKVVNHEWVKDLINSRNSLKVLDVCGGSGIAGAAFAKVLKDRGLGVDVVVIDLRGEALEIAGKFIREEAGVEPELLKADAVRLHNAGLGGDLALLWGLTTPHFSPWDLMRVVSGIASNLVSDGVLIIEEFDRHAGIFLENRYRHVMPEATSEGKVTVSVHDGRDPLTGYVSRVLVNLKTGESVRMKVYFWDIASAAAITWAFFRNVDFIKGKSASHGYIISKWPRKELRPEDLAKEEPLILKHS